MKQAIIVVVCGAGLAGCADMQTTGVGGTAASDHCDGSGVCKVSISVTKCVVAIPVPDPLYVDSTAKKIDINWELDFWPWFWGNTFDSNDGIAIADPKDQFDMPEVSGGGKKFKLRDKNDYKADFKYKVHVRSSVYGDCPILDPTIKNQG